LGVGGTPLATGPRDRITDSVRPAGAGDEAAAAETRAIGRTVRAGATLGVGLTPRGLAIGNAALVDADLADRADRGVAAAGGKPPALAGVGVGVAEPVGAIRVFKTRAFAAAARVWPANVARGALLGPFAGLNPAPGVGTDQ